MVKLHGSNAPSDDTLQKLSESDQTDATRSGGQFTTMTDPYRGRNDEPSADRKVDPKD